MGLPGWVFKGQQPAGIDRDMARGGGGMRLPVGCSKAEQPAGD
ncbi:MAG TPA: hypothetical protein VHA33_23655 [Candidatus Angelobacter sp.]|nr:hypothetical protein [Candidatus Angelobacter sp.]